MARRSVISLAVLGLVAAQPRPPPPGYPTSCPGHGSFNTPINCNDKLMKYQSKVKDDQTCFEWCTAQCGTDGGWGDIGGVCRCYYPRSIRRNQSGDSQIGICLFDSPVIGISRECVNDWRTDSLADFSDAARTAWFNLWRLRQSHTRACNNDHPDGSADCMVNGTNKGGPGCQCLGDMAITMDQNDSFVDSCAKAYPMGGNACSLDFTYDNSTWTNYKWGCYPRSCTSNDADLIEQFQEGADLPGVKVKTGKCTRVGYWAGPVWLAAVICPVVLWGGLYAFYKRRHGISSNTGFTPLSQPLATEQFQQPAATNIASPDWNAEQVASPAGGSASL